jgi:ribosomal protein S18 acetylase RimI-like enzyme
MQVDYLDYLPDDFKVSAIRLYFNALKEKLEPILGSDGRAQEALASNIATDKCLVAICNGKLVGVMGIQTNKRGFVNPRLITMVRIYGSYGGILRMGGLAILHHTIGTDELYVDGVAVASEMRGKGIGSHLFDLLEQAVLKKRIKTISLEVIDTNPRAKAFYERLGFVAVKTQTLWPLNLFIRFPFRSATLMVKTMG